ncbi:hypothetical protein [Kibdelosporangium philippinense]|uniref:hypothetical protein n=1 Tax=Kibdelosporangium philippinense TaxID=211113 RepID=UPI003619E6FE
MIDGGKLGAGVPIGVPLSPSARPATTEVGGKIAILDPQKQTLILADTKNPPEKALTVALPVGDYDGPMSTGDVVVLVDRQSGNVLTYTPDGARKDTKRSSRRAERQGSPVARTTGCTSKTPTAHRLWS